MKISPTSILGNNHGRSSRDRGIPIIDFQVRWFDEDDETVIREQIEAEPFSCYENPYGQTVMWELVQIFTIEQFEPNQSGDEVIGFIVNIDELQDLTS